MIIDRTAQDVELAKSLRKKVQNKEALTNEQILAIERGTCTVNMLNRVEAKQAELAQVLRSYAYMVHIENKTDWKNGDIFTYEDHERLLNNLDKLKNAFFVYSTTPTTPTYMYEWRNANDIEKILFDIEKMVDDVISHFRECGTFECGE